MTSRKLQVWLPLLLGIVMSLGMLAGFQLSENSGGKARSNDAQAGTSLQELMTLIEQKYVDSISTDSLEWEAMEAVLQHLDPHTVFIPATDLAEANSDIEGSFSGIGIEYMMLSDTLHVVYPYPNGPAARGGLKPGDKIVKIDDEIIAGKKLTTNILQQKIRGSRNSEIRLEVLRDSKTVNLELVRDFIPVASVDATYIVAPGIGYINITQFTANTYREFMDAANNLIGKGMQKLILDLRGNTGGVLDAATFIADELLTDGLTLVTTRGMHTKTESKISEKPGLFEKGPLVVLMDKFSASASEVLAGALQDNDRGTIIGHRSFGKGLVQEQFDLTNGGAVRLTIARYYTPTGRSIQKPYQGGAYKAHLHLGDSLSETTSAVQKVNGPVFTTKKGKKLYGGGGITPDIEVPYNTSGYPFYLPDTLDTDVLNQFSFRTFLQFKTEIQSFKQVEAYRDQFKLPASTWASLVQYAREQGQVIPNLTPAQQEDLLFHLKAQIAQIVWRNEGYLKCLQPSDQIINKAVSYLQTQ